MINWLKYFPLELRRVEKYQKHATPMGPSFLWARTLRYRIGGSQLSFKAPRHRPHSSGYESFNAGSFKDLLEFPFYHYSPTVMPDQCWQSQSILNRTWAFYGPWFTGAQYQLDMSVVLITPSKPQNDVSLFHPRAFEHALADFLTTMYGHDTYGDEMCWRAPVNWSPKDQLPVPSVVFDVLPAIEEAEGHRKQIFYFPVSDKHLLEVVLTHEFFQHNMAATIEERKQYFDIEPMETLADQVLNSFQLKLSPQIQAQLDKVKAECPDMHLVENFAPLKWTADLDAETVHESAKLEKAQ